MKIIRFIIFCVYIILVIPIGVIMMGSLAYGAIVEVTKIIKKEITKQP
jgi:hypothetical protein